MRINKAGTTIKNLSRGQILSQVFLSQFKKKKGFFKGSYIPKYL